MDGIKLSSLKNAVCRINGSRKSKGKFAFVQKIKYFFLILKYDLVGISRFEGEEINDLIAALNMKAITYKNAIEKLEDEKEKIDTNLAGLYERVGSIDSNQYDNMNADKRLFEAASKAIGDKQIIDRKIDNANKALEKVEKDIANIEDEQETRAIENEVNSVEVNEEPVVPTPVVEEQPVVTNTTDEWKHIPYPKEEKKEEPAMEEKVETPVVEPISNEEINNLEEKIVNNVETPAEETPVEEDEYTKIQNKYNEIMQTEMKNFSNSFHGMFMELARRISEATMDVCKQIQEQDRKEAQVVIDAKDAELDEAYGNNKKLTEENTTLTNDLNTANDTIADRDKEIEELKAALAERNTEIAKLQDEKTKLIDQHNEEITNLNAQHTEETTNLNKKLSDTEAARQKFEDLANKRAQAIQVMLGENQEAPVVEGKTR